MHLANLSPFNESGRLREPVLDLLDLFEINYDTQLSTLVQRLVAQFITKDTERWHEQEIFLSNAGLERFWDAIKACPLYNPFNPTSTDFSYILVVGGSLEQLDRKNAGLVYQIARRGIRAGRLVHLSGERQTDPRMDNTELLYQQNPGGLPVRLGWKLKEPYSDEAGMTLALLDRSVIPPEVANLPTDFVVAKKTTGMRAHTGDTYAQWVSQYQPEPGRILIISISPHVPFQYWDAIHHLGPHGFEIEIAGPSAEFGPQTVSFFTGAFARWFRSYARANGMFEEYLVHTSKNPPLPKETRHAR